jgi:hypothetical protein
VLFVVNKTPVKVNRDWRSSLIILATLQQGHNIRSQPFIFLKRSDSVDQIGDDSIAKEIVQGEERIQSADHKL